MGNKIRQFLRDLLGSRLASHLEYELLQLRQDCDLRLQEKDRIIADLKAEKLLLNGKVDLYTMTLLPHASRAGADLVNYQKPKTPNFGLGWSDFPKAESSWEKVQREHNERVAKEVEEEKKDAQVSA
jgi:hypothetical protein